VDEYTRVRLVRRNLGATWSQMTVAQDHCRAVQRLLCQTDGTTIQVLTKVLDTELTQIVDILDQAIDLWGTELPRPRPDLQRETLEPNRVDQAMRHLAAMHEEVQTVQREWVDVEKLLGEHDDAGQRPTVLLDDDLMQTISDDLVQILRVIDRARASRSRAG
jgi:hypothetical protein